jgi:hypothetical protein
MQAEQDMLDLKNCREHRRRVIGIVKVYDYKLFCQVKGLLIISNIIPKNLFLLFLFLLLLLLQSQSERYLKQRINIKMD